MFGALTKSLGCWALKPFLGGSMRNSTKKKSLLVAVLTVVASAIYFLAFR